MSSLNRETLARNIERRALDDIERCNICGASVLVEQSGETVYKKHFGTVAPNSDVPVSDSTLFRLASMTKPITSAAAMILVDRGVLSLNDTVDKFYPEFSTAYVCGEIQPQKITVKNILTHTSGIGSGKVWTDAVDKMTENDIASVDDFVGFLSKQPLSFVSGTKQEYSGVGAFSVLTGIIQKITGLPYEDFLKKEIFEPCRMENTTFVPTDGQWSRLIAMHDRKDGRNEVGLTYEGCVFDFFPTTNYLGGAGLVSSLGDYLNFTRMLRDGGSFEGRRILSEKAVGEISTAQLSEKIQPGKERWGLGVRVITGDAHRLPVGSYGWSGAYGTHFWIDPENEIIAIYMKNSRYDGGSGAKTAYNFEKDVYSALK